MTARGRFDGTAVRGSAAGGASAADVRDAVDGPAGGAAGAAASVRSLVLLCVAVVVVRVSFVLQPLRNDEGGYLYVARRWRAGGEHLYGDLFVDRPPLLLALFRLAALSEWDGAVRVIAVPAAVVFVVAAWSAGARLAGHPGARWGSLAGAALVCHPLLAADQAEGELFAAVLVLVALALGLAARDARGSGSQRWLAVVAGLAAGSAPLVKQSAVEALVVLAVAGVVLARRGVGTGGHGLGALAWAGAGVAVPVAASGLVLAWAGADPGAAWRDLVAFRGAALDVIWSQRPGATVTRAVQLAVLLVVTGVGAAVVAWVAAVRAGVRRSRTEVGTTGVVLAVGVVAVAAGGSYWPAYGLQLAPVVVLAVAAVAPGAGRSGRWMRVSARTMAATSVAGAVAMAVVYATVPAVWFQQRTGEWLARSAVPGDSAVVTYGHPSILEAADLPTPYPFLWSVPMRTLDPDQGRLRATLAGDGAPTWLVQVNDLDSWGIDATGRLRTLVEQRYRVVAVVCGNPVWLRSDVTRVTAPPPDC